MVKPQCKAPVADRDTTPAESGRFLDGYPGADFELREPHLPREICKQPERWLQLMGHPAKRRDPHPEDAVVPLEKAGKVFRTFREPRFMDETTCLHAGSLIIPGGMACLNLSCDGSHYKPRDEFLEKSPGFWPGTPASNIKVRGQNGHREFGIVIICIMAAR